MMIEITIINSRSVKPLEIRGDMKARRPGD